MMVVGGACWLACALAVGLLLLQYLGEGAGLQAFGFFGLTASTTSVGLGLVHVVGLFAAACLCFVIGVGLCALGLVPAPEVPRATTVIQPGRVSFIRWLAVSRPWRQSRPSDLRCVRCSVSLAQIVHICPECGWTQPYNHVA